MKILLLSPFAGSPRHGMVLRSYYFAKSWVELGHEVTIVAASWVHTRSFQPKVNKRISIEYIDGVKYVWVLTPPYSENISVGRLLSMFLFTAQAMFLPKDIVLGQDVVIASSPHPFSIYPAAHISKKQESKLVYDIRDLWPLTIKQIAKKSDRNIVVKLMQHAEDYACRYSDLVTAVPQNCENYLRSRGLSSNKFLHVGNGAMDYNKTKKIPKNYFERLEKLKQQKKFIVGYTGALGNANSLDTLVKSLSLCNDKIHVVLLGKGDKIQHELVKLSVSQGVSGRVHFFSSLPAESVRDFCSHLHVGYVGLKALPLFEMGVSSTKMNDYMLTQKPILHVIGDRCNDVALSGCGVCCNPEDVVGVAKALDYLHSLTNKELKQMGEKGYSWCRENKMVLNLANKVITKLIELK